MNALLTIPLKTLLKLTVKTPYAVRAANIAGVNIELMPSEIAHILLIAARKTTDKHISILCLINVCVSLYSDARFEIELIYFLNPF